MASQEPDSKPASQGASTTGPAGTLRLGLAVWGHGAWFGTFYPQGARRTDALRLCAQRVDAVEGNTTFYGVPSPDALARWRAEVPRNFRFCPKVHRDLTHGGDLRRGAQGLGSFHRRMSLLGDRLGPVMIQFPASVGPESARDLRGFFAAWLDTGHPAVVELRHPAWYRSPHREALVELLREHRLGRTVLDTRVLFDGEDDPQRHSQNRKPALPVQAAAVGPRAFVRWITHPDPGRNARIGAAWAERVDRWLRGGTDVWFFVHCPVEDHSPRNLLEFHQRLVELGSPVEPLDWSELPKNEEQLDLF